jgi:hypothetical protein
MGVKRHDGGATVGGPRRLYHALHEMLVAQMDAVENADG